MPMPMPMMMMMVVGIREGAFCRNEAGLPPAVCVYVCVCEREGELSVCFYQSM